MVELKRQSLFSQENNAIAVVDMQTETFIDIYGLGFKHWNNYTFDPSDKDSGRLRLYCCS